MAKAVTCVAHTQVVEAHDVNVKYGNVKNIQNVKNGVNAMALMASRGGLEIQQKSNCVLIGAVREPSMQLAIILRLAMESGIQMVQNIQFLKQKKKKHVNMYPSINKVGINTIEYLLKSSINAMNAIKVVYADEAVGGMKSVERPLTERVNSMFHFFVSTKKYHPRETAAGQLNSSDVRLMRKDGRKSGLSSSIKILSNRYYNIVISPEYRAIVSSLINNEVNNDIPLFLEVSFESNKAFTKELSFVNPLALVSNMTASSLRLLNEENAGGNSEYSEAFSFEILRLIFGSQVELLKTEMEIKYWLEHWKMTDYMIGFKEDITTNTNTNTSRSTKIGVSVTRAMTYCFCDSKRKRERGGKCSKVGSYHIFSREKARQLLIKKLTGVNESTEGVLLHDQWKRQILFIWSMEPYITDLLKREWIELNRTDAELVSNTILFVVTVNTKKFWWIFFQSKLKEPKYKFIINNSKKNKKKRKLKEMRLDTG